MIDLQALRIPVGSLVVDATLVVSLIWWGATITERMQTIDGRLQAVESTNITPEADRRIALLEANKIEIDRRLDRIESKIDLLIDRPNGFTKPR